MKSHIIVSKALLILFVMFGAHAAFGATVYETGDPTGTVSDTATSSASFSAPSITSNTLRYVFRYRIATGTTFDRLQVSVPVDFTVMPDSETFLILSTTTPFESCTAADNSCFQAETLMATLSGAESNPTPGTIQWIFSTTTTITNTQQYLYFQLDPNPPYPKTYKHNDTTGSTGYSSNGFNYQNINTAPSIRLCNGPCDTDTFDTSGIGGAAPSEFFIDIVDPEPYGTTTGTTTVHTAALFLYNGTIGTTTRAEILIYNAVTGELEDSIFQIVPAGYDISLLLENDFELSTGSKNMVARYVIAGTNQNLMQPAETFFNVVTNSYLAATGLETPLSSPFDLSQIDCDTFDVGCQFQKALAFVFIPRQGTLDKYADLWQELKYLKPFGYVTAVFSQLENVGETAVGDYTLPDIPFADSIFTPIKNGLAILLWGLYAFVFYRRIKDIDI